MAEGLSLLGGVDPGNANLVLLAAGIEHGYSVAIGNADNAAKQGIGVDGAGQQNTISSERRIDKNDPVFQEFIGYWQLSEEMIAKASKDDLAETARILAMQAAHMTRKYGEQPLPDLAHLLSASTLDDESIALMRDGAEAFVGVLATVSGGTLEEIDAPMQ